MLTTRQDYTKPRVLPDVEPVDPTPILVLWVDGVGNLEPSRILRVTRPTNVVPFWLIHQTDGSKIQATNVTIIYR